MERLQRFSIRKLSIGAVSCVIGTVAFFSYSTEVKAAENTDPSLKIVETNKANNPATSDVTVDNTNKQAVVNTSDQSKSDDSSAVASTSERNQLQTSQDSSIKVKENNLNTDKSDTPKAVVQPTSLNDENKLRDPDSKDVEVKPKESSNVDTNEQKETSTVLSKQPANADTQLAATTSGVQPFMNLAVVSDNNDLTPKRETVDSTWTLHYVNQADHKQELKDPTVMTMQYERTNTPQSDGKIQYGDWSYVPGSFKQTGTPITVKDSDNPVKQDNIDKNGENFDVFTITAMYPTVAGYNFYNGINGTRLHDNLRNNERQADAMSKDFYAEYDVAKERSVNVKFVDDQSFDPNVSGGKAQVGQAITLTGRDGDTVKVNVTVPDKYQLANGQQLPTTYTFTAGSGDVTIHLAHKVVQREAAVDVQIGFMTWVDFNDVRSDEPNTVVTQNQWRQLDDEIKKDYDLFHDLAKVIPSIKVGTLTGHVNYDLVDNKVVSFGNDWTNLNLGGQTYQMPDGTDVVNGVLVIDDSTWGQPLREMYLKDNPNADHDYATRPWHGYLSVNKSNIPSDIGWRLVGSEPNVLAKATDDRAATAVEMTNKPIDLSSLQVSGDGVQGLSQYDFNEQDGQLRAKATFPVLGVYIPYVEKTATRTINVTMPDGKTATVKQTATLVKQIGYGEDVHLDWTTGEWANYTVPTIPGYTASQSSVAKEAVTGTTEDQTVNITYTANPQTATVVYQTEDGTPVHTTTVNGKTGQTVKVSNEVPTGWRIVNGNVPSEITFGPNGTSKTVVTIVHSHATVTPDAPKTTGDKLPDNPGKIYPAGVGHDDLNKTITGTIKVTMPDGQVKTVVKTAHLTRTADVDEVTGEVTYSDWTTGYWSDYTAPSVPGYTANYPYIAGQLVTGETKDQTVNITYTANDGTQTIIYQGENDSEIGKQVIHGKTDETVKVTPDVPDGYVVKGEIPTEVTIKPDDTPITVTVKHGESHVTPDKPVNKGDLIPDTKDKHYPEGLTHNDLNKTVTREITITDPTGKKTTTTQTVTFTRGATVDEVTNEVTYDDWSENGKHTFDKVDVPNVPGYTASSDVPSVVVTPENKSTTVKITYTANDGSQTIVYEDKNDGEAGKQVVPGKTDQTVKVTPEIPDGYVVTGEVPSEVTIKPKDTPIVVHVEHGKSHVTPDKPVNKGDLIPGTKDKHYPDGLTHDDLNKTVTRDVEITTPDGRKTSTHQEVTFTRGATVDEVTGKVTYGTWSEGGKHTFEKADVPTVPGYTASGNVPSVVVTPESKSSIVKITYTENGQKASENSSNTDVTDQNDANVDENNNGHQISNDPTDDKSNDSNKDREKVKKTRKSGQLGLNNNSNSRLSKENKGFTKPDKDNFEQAKQEKQLPQAGESKDSLSIMGLVATALFGVFSFGLKKKKKE